MRVLYIGRSWAGLPWRKQFRERVLKRRRFTGQQGFFEASLHAAAAVKVRSLGYLERHAESVHRLFDAVVVNSRCRGRRGGAGYGLDGPADVACLAKVSRIPRLLLVVDANAARLPPESVLDVFDLVFKREMFRDRERYEVSPRNREKLRATMLACPLVRLSRSNVRDFDASTFLLPGPQPVFEQDVFFSGAASNALRREVIERVRAMPVQSYTGLQMKNARQQGLGDTRLSRPALSHDDYVLQTRKSRINLVLEGYGQFVYRHLELWCLQAFMLSSPSLREISLPIENPVEGIHYAAFDDLADLEQKIRYYARREEERSRMAREGRKLFERIYDPGKHGRYIAEQIQGVAA